MQSLEYGRVDLAQLNRLGSVTMIHGGAGPLSEKMELSENAQEACLDALTFSGSQARAGVREVDVPYERFVFSRRLSLAEAQVIANVLRLEASPSFNSGFGAALQEDGKCRLTAAFMESSRRRLSAVINAEQIRHPSLLAVHLQNERHGVRDVTGSALLMRSLGIPLEDPVSMAQLQTWFEKRKKTLEGQCQWSEGTGTVGSVSCDAEGNLAALTSTGGIGFEAVGRVGDVATVAGTYCTARTAISCTGFGEDIVSQAVAARLSVRLEDCGNPEFALEQTLLDAQKSGHRFAFICVHKFEKGVLWARGATTERFVWGVANDEGVRVSNT